MNQRPASEGDNEPLPTPHNPISVVRLADSTPPSSPDGRSAAGAAGASGGGGLRGGVPQDGAQYVAVVSAATADDSGDSDRGVGTVTVTEGEGMDGNRPPLPVSGPL
jgi:hypothetical protein